MSSHVILSVYPEDGLTGFEPESRVTRLHDFLKEEARMPVAHRMILPNGGNRHTVNLIIRGEDNLGPITAIWNRSGFNEEMGFVPSLIGVKTFEDIVTGHIKPRGDHYWYVGSPYSKYPAHPDVTGEYPNLESAFREVCRQVAILGQAGRHTYSPIAHGHPISVHGGIDPYDHAIWLPMDRPMMMRAHGLIICKMTGWQESYGIMQEVRTFIAAGKPVIEMEPGQVPDIPGF